MRRFFMNVQLIMMDVSPKPPIKYFRFSKPANIGDSSCSCCCTAEIVMNGPLRPDDFVCIVPCLHALEECLIGAVICSMIPIIQTSPPLSVRYLHFPSHQQLSVPLFLIDTCSLSAHIDASFYAYLLSKFSHLMTFTNLRNISILLCIIPVFLHQTIFSMSTFHLPHIIHQMLRLLILITYIHL